MTAVFSKAFKLLAELVELTNGSKVEDNEKIVASIFEPKKKADISFKIGDFYTSRPVLLREMYSNLIDLFISKFEKQGNYFFI